MFAGFTWASISRCERRVKQGLSLRVSQHLALTPQLQQSIRLLQLSTLELSQEIEQMLDDNPFLEKDHETAEREEYGLDRADAVAQDDDAATDTVPDSAPEMPMDRVTEVAVDNSSSDAEPSLDGVAEGWEGDGSVDFSPDDSEWGGDAPA
ncbi:MAG: polymerase sigma-54 factor, partial [Pseudomonadota bacterium]